MKSISIKIGVKKTNSGSSLVFEGKSKQVLSAFLADKQGELLMTVSELPKDVTQSQLIYFKCAVVPAFIRANAKEQGVLLSEMQAIDFLCGEYAGGKELDDCNFQELSDLIDGCKQLLQDYFNILI